MSIALTVINLLLFVGLLIPIGMVAYLMLLTVAAWRANGETVIPAGSPTNRFIFLVPAHNEATLLPDTVANLKALDYPAELYDIHVVADNCSDDTAALARAGGAIAHERFHESLKGKGYALQWLLKQIWETQVPHDAIIILDADTIVSKNFLQVMDARLNDGAKAIQAYYAVRDPGNSPAVGLRYIALAVLHYLRPMGRMILGGSAGLKGNGMVFRANLMHEHEWTAHLTEDIEFHMSLIAAGERVMFAPDAVVWAEMPQTLDGSATQNERWERGRVEMMRLYVPRLLKQAAGLIRQGNVRGAYLCFDAAMEHLIPPFTMLVGLSGALTALAMILFSLSLWLVPAAVTLAALNLGLSLFLLLGQVIYVASGLKLAKAPSSVYKALLHAPAFMFWKVALYGRVITGRQQEGWIRTARNEE